MSFSKSFKRFQRFIARINLFIFYAIYSVLPYNLVIGISKGLFFIAYPLLIRQRNIAMDSLSKAFRKEKSRDEIGRIMKECFLNLGWAMVEMLYFLSHPKMVHDRVHYEGRHHLDEALKKGKGVVAVTAHFGNFPLMMYSCALEGYKTNSIIRPTRDEKVEKFLLEKREQAGLKTIYAVPRRRCVNESIKVLRNNEILFIPLDQNFGSGGGVFVEFFGQQAATATGPVVFAARTGAVILPMFIIREKGDQHKIIIEPPFDLKHMQNEEEMIQVNIAHLTKLIESYIRKYPHEWGWMHRRWKSKQVDVNYIPNA